jgi:hypothetical protein
MQMTGENEITELNNHQLSDTQKTATSTGSFYKKLISGVGRMTI